MKTPPKNFLDVKISYACNFKCEYCYQVEDNKRITGTLKKEHIDSLVNYIIKTGLTFHITLAGGEPFLYPHLEYISQKLVGIKQYLRIITNFSAPEEKIKNFLLLTNGFLEYLSVSVHLSQWNDMEDFYSKVQNIVNFINEKNLSVKLFFTCVLTKSNEAKVRTLVERMSKYGLSLEIQRAYYSGKYELYSKETEAFFRTKGLDVPPEKISKTNFFGKFCYSGCNFLYVEANGDVYRCYTPQENEKLYKLGNLKEPNKISLLKKAFPCLAQRECICFKHFQREQFLTTEGATEDEIKIALNFNRNIFDFCKRIKTHMRSILKKGK